MALATEKLYYRRGGVTYAINTYTALSDVGSEALKVRVNGANRFIALGAVGDARQSYMRVQKGGATKAVLNSAITYVGVWAEFGHPAVAPSDNSGKSGSSTYSVSVDYNRVYASSTLYNLYIRNAPAGTGYGGYSLIATIDGVNQAALAPGGTAFYRLSTGTHSVTLRWATSRRLEGEYTGNVLIGYNC